MIDSTEEKFHREVAPQHEVAPHREVSIPESIDEVKRDIQARFYLRRYRLAYLKSRIKKAVRRKT